MKKLREDIIDEYSNVVGTIQMMTGTDDSDVEQTLIYIDSGKVDQQDLIAESPISLPDAIDTLTQLNDEIKAQQELINSIEG